MVWGIANDLYDETWALTKSGLFCFSKEFQENKLTPERTGYRGGEEAKRPIPPGEWMEFTWAIRTAVDFFLFQSRFTDAFGPGQGIHLSLRIGPLAGRKLVCQRWEIEMGFGAPEPSRAPFFEFERTVDGETLRTSWEGICAEVLKQLFDLFPNIRITQDTLLKWIEKYKTRRF